MKIFIERYLLPILAGLTLLFAATNPMGLDGRHRIVGVVVAVILAAISAHFAGRQWELRRWERMRGLFHHRRNNQYLSATDADLGSAVKMMAWRSAWGKWFSAQLLANQDKPIDKEGIDRQVMQIAAHHVTEAATDGKLQVRGRPPDSVSFEPIPREAWRLIALHMVPDVATLWRLIIIPRGGAEMIDGKLQARSPPRVAHIFSYDSLIVDSRQFESLWPEKDRATDRDRKRLLQKARRKGIVDPELIKGIRA